MRTLIYDGTCGVCRKVVNYLVASNLIKQEELMGVTSQNDFKKITHEYNLILKDFNEMILVKDLTIYLGYFAFREIFKNSRSNFRFLFLLPFSDRMGPFIYRVFSRNRTKFQRNSNCGLK